VSFALQIKALIALVGTAGVVGAFIYIKNSLENWIKRKRERDKAEQKIAILKDQRDSSINNIDDADAFWMQNDKTGH
jgi:hypothetical protein